MKTKPVSHFTATILATGLALLLGLTGALASAGPLGTPPPTPNAELASQAKDLSQKGLDLIKDGNLQGALATFKQALDLYRLAGDGAGEVKTMINIGSIHLDLGEKQQAMQDYEQALALARALQLPDQQARALVNMGMLHKDEGDLGQALDYYLQALPLLKIGDDRANEALILNGVCGLYVDLKDYTNALNYCNQALALWQTLDNPEMTETAYKLIELISALTDLNPAPTVTRPSSVWPPTTPAPTSTLTLPSLEAQKLIAEADDHYKKKNYTEALHPLRQVLALYPDSPEASFAQAMIGDVYYDSQDYDQAIAAYQAVLDHYPTSPWGDEAYYSLAMSYYRKGNTGQALAMLRALIETFPNSPYLTRARQNIQSIENGLVPDLPDNGEVCDNDLEQGENLYQRQDYEHALTKFKAALECSHKFLNPAVQVQALTYIGRIHSNRGNYQEALVSYRQALDLRRQLDDRHGEGLTLSNIGSVYYLQADYKAAMNYYHDALAIARELDDQDGEAIRLNSIGNIYSSISNYEQALAHYQQALAISKERNDQADQALAFNNIGHLYESQGQYSEALKWFKEALDIQQSLEDRAAQAITLSNLGATYAGQGLYSKALGHYKDALDLMIAVGDRHNQASVLSNMGVVQQNQGDYQSALNSTQQAMDLSREIGNRVSEAHVLLNRGAIYASLGRYELALHDCERAKSIAFEVLDSSGISAAYNCIGVIYSHQGQPTAALLYYQHALSMTETISDPGAQVAALTNLGVRYAELGMYKEAEEKLTRALSVQNDTDQDSAIVVNTNLGNVYRLAGNRSKAQEAYERAISICREISVPESVGALRGLGVLAREQGDYDQAQAYLEKALSISDKLDDLLSEGETRVHMGILYLEQEHYDEALDQYQAGLKCFEDVRAQAGDEQARGGFIDQYSSVYDHVIGLYQRLGRAEQAFDISERGRARAFIDSLSTGRIALPNRLEALQNREQAAFAQRRALQHALTQALARSADPATIEALKKQLDEAQQAYQAVLADIDQNAHELGELIKGRSQILTLTQVQSYLNENTTLVSYWVMPKQTLAFVVTRNAIHSRALDVTEDELVTLTERLQINSDSAIPIPVQAISLYQKLIAPLKAELGPVRTQPRHLVLMPHRVLHYVPFAALSDGQRFLIDDYIISYLPSASALPFIQDNASGRQLNAPLILGSPSNNLKPPPPNTRGEATEIAALYGVEPLLDWKAGESTLKEKASQAGIVHIAAHASFSPALPLESVIWLAPDTLASGGDDGQLKVQEVYGLTLTRASLVTLSACETYIADLKKHGAQTRVVSPGDELVSLVRAFFFARVPSVLATLWSVQDDSSTELMKYFYGHLRDGQGKAQALRSAQLELRSKHPNPYYWAGFVLTGDVGIDKLEGAKPAPKADPRLVWLGLGAGLAVVLLGTAWVKRRRG